MDKTALMCLLIGQRKIIIVPICCEAGKVADLYRGLDSATVRTERAGMVRNLRVTALADMNSYAITNDRLWLVEAEGSIRGIESMGGRAEDLRDILRFYGHIGKGRIGIC